MGCTTSRRTHVQATVDPGDFLCLGPDLTIAEIKRFLRSIDRRLPGGNSHCCGGTNGEWDNIIRTIEEHRHV